MRDAIRDLIWNAFRGAIGRHINSHSRRYLVNLLKRYSGRHLRHYPRRPQGGHSRYHLGHYLERISGRHSRRYFRRHLRRRLESLREVI